METNKIYKGRLSASGGWIVEEHIPFDISYVASQLPRSEGWMKQATPQDNWYFGHFVNFEKNMMVTYVEGDLITVYHVNNYWFEHEWHRANAFYQHG